jgi:hypothetical protein
LRQDVQDESNCKDHHDVWSIWFNLTEGLWKQIVGWGLTDGWRQPKVLDVELELKLEQELKFEFGLDAEREEVRIEKRST